MRLAIGRTIHWASDQLHLLAHWIIGDPDWRARNGTQHDPAASPFQDPILEEIQLNRDRRRR